MGSPRPSATVLLLLGLVAVGCNRVPAEEALAEARQELEDARAHIERFAPEELAPLRRALERARTAVDEGRYTDALRLAQDLPARIYDAVEAANRRELAVSLASSRTPPDVAGPSPPAE